ncbi:MAG: hypothetical protein NT170_00940 [Candidatus Moranbacteria bacterium]|nr:hypothetical protein [Candidatus Moranbacteria bacterium]
MNLSKLEEILKKISNGVHDVPQSKKLFASVDIFWFWGLLKASFLIGITELRTAKFRERLVQQVSATL